MYSHNLLTINIADWDVTLALAEEDSALRRRIAEHYSAFLVPKSTDGLTVHVQIVPGPEYIPFVEGGDWQVQTSENNGRIEFKSHFENGWIERSLNRGELTMRPNGNPENFLRVIYAWKCLEHESLLLHACGVIKDQRGYAFFGHSGSGKTTIARLSLDHTVLSDDMVIIKKCGGAFRICGVPFRGEFVKAPRTNGTAELAGLFTLVKDAQDHVTPLPRTEAVARLSSCVPFVMAQPANARKVMDLCAEIAASVPIRALHFKPEPGFWRVINGIE